MKRREVLGGMALPGLLGLVSCAPQPDGGIVGQPAPSVDTLWQMIPQAVREKMTNSPALRDAPTSGIAEVRHRSNARGIVIYRIGEIGPLVAQETQAWGRAGVNPNVTSTLFWANLMPFAQAGNVVVYGTNDVLRGYEFRSGNVLRELDSVEGQLFPLRRGNRLVISHSLQPLTPGWALTGQLRRLTFIDTVEDILTAPQLWSRLATGEIQSNTIEYLGDQPGFLMGDHAVIGVDGGKAEFLYSPMLARTVMTRNTTNPQWTLSLPGRAGVRRVRGEGWTLSPAGAERLREAVAALRTMQIEMVQAGGQTGADRRQRAQARFAEGYSQLASRRSLDAVRSFQAGIGLYSGNAAAHYYLAEALRQVPTQRPSTQAAAADRLARFHWGIAAMLDTEGPEGQAARQRLASA